MIILKMSKHFINLIKCLDIFKMSTFHPFFQVNWDTMTSMKMSMRILTRMRRSARRVVRSPKAAASTARTTTAVGATRCRRMNPQFCSRRHLCAATVVVANTRTIVICLAASTAITIAPRWCSSASLTSISVRALRLFLSEFAASV